jgi:hypothetical protein
MGSAIIVIPIIMHTILMKLESMPWDAIRPFTPVKITKNPEDNVYSLIGFFTLRPAIFIFMLLAAVFRGDSQAFFAASRGREFLLVATLERQVATSPGGR